MPRSAGPHRDHHDTVIDKAGKMVAGVAVHARPNPITCHPFLAPDRPAKARGPLISGIRDVVPAHPGLTFGALSSAAADMVEGIAVLAAYRPDLP